MEASRTTGVFLTVTLPNLAGSESCCMPVRRCNSRVYRSVCSRLVGGPCSLGLASSVVYISQRCESVNVLLTNYAHVCVCCKGYCSFI